MLVELQAQKRPVNVSYLWESTRENLQHWRVDWPVDMQSGTSHMFFI